MRKATDTTLRSLAMLQAIPVQPHSKSTRQIKEELAELDPDFDVSTRSIQRNLEKLSAIFPIASDPHGRANHWYWVDRNALTQIPAMSVPTAFVLRMAGEYLKSVMPPSVLRQLDAYFKHADRMLERTALGRWRNKAAIIQQGPVLKSPPVRPDVQEAVYDALLKNRRLGVAYRSRARPRPIRLDLNPLGLVVRTGVAYLVATSGRYEDVRHYVLHRIRKANLLDETATAPAGFRLLEHIQDDNRFSYPVSRDNLQLKALFDANVATHMTESRLAADHRTTRQDDGRLLVEATVADTSDLRWWLLSFGAAVEVLEPESLRAEFEAQARRLGAIYQLGS